MAEFVLAIKDQFVGLKKNWSEYMINFPKMNIPTRKGSFFDFTDIIKKDLQTFIISQVLSQHSTSEDSVALLQSTAEEVFKDFNDVEFIKENGFYHQLIMDCAYMKPLLLKQSPKSLSEGCLYFKRSLTSNGLCHTFNGKKPSKLWKQSAITNIIEDKLMSAHDDDDFKFRGTGVSEGKT